MQERRGRGRSLPSSAAAPVAAAGGGRVEQVDQRAPRGGAVGGGGRAGAHVLLRQELHVAVRLAGAAEWAHVEEGDQPPRSPRLASSSSSSSSEAPSCSSSHARRQAYVAARSSASSGSSCGLNGTVARMKWLAMMGKRFSTITWLGGRSFPSPSSSGATETWPTTSGPVGASKGSNGLSSAVAGGVHLGFFRREGQ